MINTYEAYLNHPAGNTLNVEDALRLYNEMTDSVLKSKTGDKMEFWEDFLRNAAEYSSARTRWEFMSNSEKIENDENRTRKHDAMITSLNILSRIAEQEGLDVSWRKELGEDRKSVV